MSDWAVGDSAVKIDCACGGRHSYLNKLTSGTLYHVIGIRLPIGASFDGCLAPCGLILAEDDGPHRHLGFCSVGFRKVVSDEQQPCEAEFVTLLKRSKVRLPETIKFEHQSQGAGYGNVPGINHGE